MAPIEIGEIRELVEAAVTAISVLGGLMAFCSGRAASAAISEHSQASDVSAQINEGLGVGFDWGIWSAAITFMIVL